MHDSETQLVESTELEAASTDRAGNAGQVIWPPRLAGADWPLVKVLVWISTRNGGAADACATKTPGEADQWLAEQRARGRIAEQGTVEDGWVVLKTALAKGEIRGVGTRAFIRAERHVYEPDHVCPQPSHLEKVRQWKLDSDKAVLIEGGRAAVEWRAVAFLARDVVDLFEPTCDLDTGRFPTGPFVLDTEELEGSLARTRPPGKLLRATMRACVNLWGGAPPEGLSAKERDPMVRDELVRMGVVKKGSLKPSARIITEAASRLRQGQSPD